MTSVVQSKTDWGHLDVLDEMERNRYYRGPKLPDDLCQDNWSHVCRQCGDVIPPHTTCMKEKNSRGKWEFTCGVCCHE